jgi:L,D-transpeptidase-like protein
VRINRLIAPITAATIAVLMFGQIAHADLLIQVDKSAQRMTVTVDGKQLYDWPVSTGGRNYETPSGTFKPFRMEIDHHSDEWDNAPMPYSIFFTKTGDAVHGTYEQRNLGRAVSHGCVRLSVRNAATLWELVKREKMANTTVVLSGAIPDARPPAVARSQPLQLAPDAASYGAPMPLTADDQSYDEPLPQYQRRYDDDRPLLPSPFFFGR